MNDLISRQAAIDTLNVGTELLRRVLDDADVVGVERAKYEWGLGLIELYISDIKELPSAQPERKTGRWIPDNTDYYRTRFICSVCGESEEVPTTGFGYGTMWGYCPNCGADMRGEQE